jgi:hypothetical protein
VIMHATHNGAIQSFSDRITEDTGPTGYLTGEFRVAFIPFMLALACCCWRSSDDGTIRSIEAA